MLANSEFVALLKQANTDSSKMAEVIGVSEAQLRFVTNTASGMGLIKCGSVVIPRKIDPRWRYRRGLLIKK